MLLPKYCFIYLFTHTPVFIFVFIACSWPYSRIFHINFSDSQFLWGFGELLSKLIWLRIVFSLKQTAAFLEKHWEPLIVTNTSQVVTRINPFNLTFLNFHVCRRWWRVCPRHRAGMTGLFAGGRFALHWLFHWSDRAANLTAAFYSAQQNRSENSYTSS